MKLIPLQAVASQTLSAVLEDQFVGLAVRQLRTGLYMDVYRSGTLIVGGVICQNQNRIIRSAYFNFIGDFLWFDTQGTADPDYTGIGDGGRFRLYYLTPAEIAQLVA